MGVSKVGGCSTRPRGHLWFGPLFSFYFFSVLNHYFSTGFNFLTNFCFDSNLGNSDREARTECRIPSFYLCPRHFSMFHLPILWSFVLSSFWLWHGRERMFSGTSPASTIFAISSLSRKFRSGSFSLYLLV